MSIYYIIYASKCQQGLEADQLEHILVHSSIFNKINSVTGILLFSEGHFLQLIEGNKEDVINLWNSIQADTRHYDFYKIVEGSLEERMFSDWSMCYKSENYEELQLIEAYRNPNDANHLQLSSVPILIKVLADNKIRTSLYNDILANSMLNLS